MSPEQLKHNETVKKDKIKKKNRDTEEKLNSKPQEFS